LEGLTSKEYAKELAAQIKMDEVTKSPEAGDPYKYQTKKSSQLPPEVPVELLAQMDAELMQDMILESWSTTHFSVIDKDGNMVAVTQTINSGFGSGVVVPGIGLKLNNQMANFEPLPGLANSVEPGKTPLSSMSPTLVIAPDGKPFLTLGTPGATRIFNTVMQIIVNIIDHGMNIQQAIEAPRVFCPADELFVEKRIDPAVIKKLEDLGHKVTVRGEWDMYFGGAQGIQIDPKTGRLQGGADPRRDGRAVGY